MSSRLYHNLSRVIRSVGVETDVGVNVPLPHLALQIVNNVHRHVEHSQFGLRFVGFIGLQHHTDSSQFVESIVDVPYSHPLPGVIRVSSIFLFLVFNGRL